MFGGNVGIGTTSPTNLLTVGSGAPNFAATTPQIIAASTSDARSGAVVGQGGTFIRYSSAGYGDLFSYDYGTGGAKNLVLNQFGGNVGIGTTNPQNALSVNGTIQAKQVIVNTGWSDYVFAPTYRLQPLSEVASYIKTNGHLPDIPSAGEVEAKGVNLGEMQSKLLAKVEELTLHMIEAERENRELRERIARLEAGQAKH